MDPPVLARYLHGTASAAERADVEAWIAADPRRRAAVRDLEAAWRADADHFNARYDVDHAWRRISSRMERPRRFTWSRAVAAALLVAVGASGVAFIWTTLQRRPSAHSVALRTYDVPRGRRAAFRLLDGTEILLNADSRLRVPVRFAAGRRDVYLDGEAYFSVAHDEARPFVVHTGRSTIRDIGTQFGVHAYGNRAADRVAVIEGAVGATISADTTSRGGGRGTSRETPLVAGQVATLSPTDGVRILRRVSAADAVAWTRGRLVFTSAPLSEAAEQLGRWYDLDVRVAGDELARRPVTGAYGDEPVEEVLTLITAAVGARYEWQGRSVTITRR